MGKRLTVMAAVLTTIVSAVPAMSPALAQGRLPPGFVFLRDVAPSIAQDMRYASSNNFTGRPLPGYGAPECVLRRDAALALKRVQDSLTPGRLSLKVYDCYRPQRAVQAMARWAAAPEDGKTRRFYPGLEKRTLFSGWIAMHSMHSAGIALDLTIVPLDSTAPPFDAAAHYGACSGPKAQRAPDNSLDMGTSFDCFNARSYTRNAAISPGERERRGILIAAMTRQGFKNYFREWWHYQYAGGAAPRAYDSPIPPR
jgi:D-alanyl-D-alanine dipeptidase